jgi:hypothetical protein
MKRYIIIALSAVIVLVAAAVLWLYRSPVTSAHERVFVALHLPIAKAGSTWISMNSLLQRVGVAEKIFAHNQTAPPADLKFQLLTKALDEATLSTIASARGVSVSGAELTDEYNVYATQAAGGDKDKFAQLLQSTYGLTPTDFQKNILRPEITQTKLTVWFNGNQELNQDAFAQLNKIKQALAGGQSFDDVTKAYSQDEASKPFSGDLGYIKTSDLLPELKTALAGAKTGDIIYPASRYGLHAIKVLDVKPGADGSIHLQAMFVAENGYADWYSSQAKTIKTVRFIKI